MCRQKTNCLIDLRKSTRNGYWQARGKFSREDKESRPLLMLRGLEMSMRIKIWVDIPKYFQWRMNKLWKNTMPLFKRLIQHMQRRRGHWGWKWWRRRQKNWSKMTSSRRNKNKWFIQCRKIPILSLKLLKTLALCLNRSIVLLASTMFHILESRLPLLNKIKMSLLI